MSFFEQIGSGLSELFSLFVTVVLLQNIVLTTGFGSSVMLHTVRKPNTIWQFSGIMAVYSVLTVAIEFPIDHRFGTAITNFWRPLVIVGIVSVLYLLSVILLRRFARELYSRIGAMLPLAAFNNMVIGMALISNVQMSLGFGGVIGLAIGASLAFGLLTWVTAEGIERLDNPDMPDAFRGMPSTLLYVGLVALALLGFKSDFSLI